MTDTPLAFGLVGHDGHHRPTGTNLYRICPPGNRGVSAPRGRAVMKRSREHARARRDRMLCGAGTIGEQRLINTASKAKFRETCRALQDTPANDAPCVLAQFYD